MGITTVAVGHTTLASDREAGIALGKDIVAKLHGSVPNVVIVFASPAYSYEILLQAIHETCGPEILVGCSSAGEFGGGRSGTASASILGICSDDIVFHAGLGRNLRDSMEDAVKQVLPALAAKDHADYPFRSALVLTDALAGYADDLIHEITVRTGGIYQLFGGGAADDAKFHETHIFYGREAVRDATMVLGMLSKKPIGIGVRHGWEATGAPMRVTEAQGMRLISLNSISMAEVFEQYAAQNGHTFNRDDAMPFFLQNVLGIDTGDGYKIRVPLELHADGSVSFAAEIPVGSTVHIMSSDAASACVAAGTAAQAALDGLCGEKLAGSLVFDCAATRLRLGAAFADELKTVEATLGSANYAGCNTYGQIVRVEGQFSGFHNCTAVVCAIPQ